jgi:hypothetical protein
MLATSPRDATDEIIDREFPQDDIDAVCIGAELTETIAIAMGMLPPVDGQDGVAVWVDDAEQQWLDEAAKVLAALVEAGYIRRSDFVYVTDQPHVRRV